MRVLRPMQELQDALRDWERYQRIPREQFFSDRDTRNRSSSISRIWRDFAMFWFTSTGVWISNRSMPSCIRTSMFSKHSMMPCRSTSAGGKLLVHRAPAVTDISRSPRRTSRELTRSRLYRARTVSLDPTSNERPAPDVHALELAADVGVIDQGSSPCIPNPGKHGVDRI